MELVQELAISNEVDKLRSSVGELITVGSKEDLIKQELQRVRLERDEFQDLYESSQASTDLHIEQFGQAISKLAEFEKAKAVTDEAVSLAVRKVSEEKDLEIQRAATLLVQAREDAEENERDRQELLRIVNEQAPKLEELQERVRKYETERAGLKHKYEKQVLQINLQYQLLLQEHSRCNEELSKYGHNYTTLVNSFYSYKQRVVAKDKKQLQYIR